MITLISVILLFSSAAFCQGDWEMRVCADPRAYPVSDRAQEGFDNRIAAIIADELSARLSYLWTTARGDEVVRRHMRAGDCDVMFSIADGTAGLESSVAYYRLPYVFLYRQSDGLALGSLYDRQLTELRLSTYPEGVPYNALVTVGLRDNLVLQRPVRTATGLDRFSPMVEALLDHETDLVLAYASEASNALRRHPGELEFRPVSPEITPDGLQLFRILTIGVRSGDEALRDQINLALARRWDDIQAVFADYGIPVASLPKPVAPRSSGELAARIGVVLPMPTGSAQATDIIGEAARLGAKVADDLVGREESRTGVPLQLFMAHAPNLAASVRAAERLISADRVSILVGGFTREEALALSTVAAERGALFFNVAASDDVLRGSECEANTFHIGASAAMYLDALVGALANIGADKWFFVFEDSPAGLSRAARAALAVERLGGDVVGTAQVDRQQFVYRDELEQLFAASPDAVLLLLSGADQELFMAQYERAGGGFLVTGFPTAISQTRDFLFRLRQAAPEASRYRIALWDAGLSQNGAQAVNERYVARTGSTMEPSAWATYAAIKIAYQAVVATGSDAPSELRTFLESDAAAFDVQKGPALSFRAWNHQLRQPLYLLELDTETPWSTDPTDRVALVKRIEEQPSLARPGLVATEGLEGLGDGRDVSQCRF